MSQTRPDPTTLHLTKHHGSGNDFLVLVDPTDGSRLSAEVVRALCDRRRGVGADGVIRVLEGGEGADLTMELWNADGGLAEMSGNGMRCLAQAAVEAGMVRPPEFSVKTAVGTRKVEYRPGPVRGAASASVDMGMAGLGPDQPDAFGARLARQVDMGNPHLVLLGPDPDEVDVSEVGSRLQSVHPGGINVEFVSVGPEPDALTLRVWERGVGETCACGTGSAAAAAAARSWSLVGDRVDVHNPGGTLQVLLATDGIHLRGPVHKVADVVVDVDMLLESVRS